MSRGAMTYSNNNIIFNSHHKKLKKNKNRVEPLSRLVALCPIFSHVINPTSSRQKSGQSQLERFTARRIKTTRKHAPSTPR